MWWMMQNDSPSDSIIAHVREHVFNHIVNETWNLTPSQKCWGNWRARSDVFRFLIVCFILKTSSCLTQTQFLCCAGSNPPSLLSCAVHIIIYGHGEIVVPLIRLLPCRVKRSAAVDQSFLSLLFCPAAVMTMSWAHRAAGAASCSLPGLHDPLAWTLVPVQRERKVADPPSSHASGFSWVPANIWYFYSAICLPQNSTGFALFIQFPQIQPTADQKHWRNTAFVVNVNIFIIIL